MESSNIPEDDDTVCSEDKGITCFQLHDDTTLDIIHDSCKDLNCPNLSNVCKYLVHQTICRVVNDPWKYCDYLRLWLGHSRVQFMKIYQVCKILKSECRRKDREALKKDYIEVVKKFGERFVFHIIFNLILRLIIEDFKQGKRGRIKESNFEMYKTAVKAIYRYSCEKLHVVPID